MKALAVKALDVWNLARGGLVGEALATGALARGGGSIVSLIFGLCA